VLKRDAAAVDHRHVGLVTEARSAAPEIQARRRAALARMQLCPLCGEATDRPGRFCSSCLSLPGPTEASTARPTLSLAPWLRTTGGLRWIELLFLVVDVLLGGAAAALVFRLLVDAHRGLTHGLPATRVITHSDLALATVVGAGMVISAASSGLLFSVWMFAAYHDVGALGVRRRWATGWAVGSWLVPLANLWWPKRIVDEMWFGSDRTVPPGSSVHPRATTPLVSTWWVLLLLGGALPVLGWGGYLATGQWSPRYHGPALEIALCATVFAVICRVANGLLAMVVVDGITSRQHERATALRPGPPAA